MSSLLLIISLLLHIIAFYIIYTMYNQLQVLKKTNPVEITEILDSYLQDIKEENQRLQKELNRSIDKDINSPLSLQINDLKDRPEKKKELTPSLDLVQDAEQINDQIETSLEGKVLQLHRKNFSITDIAKQLDCGKTEVELIIRFYEKKSNTKT